MAQGDHLLDLGDGEERKFNLAKIKHLLELEELCDASVMTIANRLRGGTWGIRDVREPIRLGLIGGGMAAEVAANIVRRCVDDRADGRFFAAVPYALTILMFGLSGVPEDQPPGKSQADGAEAETIASSGANS